MCVCVCPKEISKYNGGFYYKRKIITRREKYIRFDDQHAIRESFFLILLYMTVSDIISDITTNFYK